MYERNTRERYFEIVVHVALKLFFSCFMLILLNFTFYIQLTLKNIKQSCHLYLLKKNNMHPYLKTSYFQLWYVKLSFFYFHFCLCVIWICLELMLSFVDFVFWYKAIGKSRVNPLLSCKMRGTNLPRFDEGIKVLHTPCLQLLQSK